jgi:ribosomal protein S18 acetylase RimI-like enzyme
MSLATVHKIVVRRLTGADRSALEKMYESFVPLGEALSLPPRDPERRRAWLDSLAEGIQLVAYADGALAGHLSLMPEDHEAELTCFVHQDYRRQGIATALAEAAVEEAGLAGISTIWVLIDNSNAAARRGLLKFGFHIAWEDRIESKFVYAVPGK